MRSNRWRAPLAVALAGTVLGAGVGAAEAAPTNYELVSQAARQAAAHLAEGIRGACPKRSLALHGVSSHAGNFLVENALSGVLTQDGLQVRTRADSGGTVLEFEIVDLAEAWIAWQQRPFVFAFWACRPGLDVQPEELVRAFHEAKAWGLAARDEIAAAYSRRLGLAAGFLRAYLERNIDYELGARHLEGLERFYALAAGAGLIPEVRRLRLLGSRVEALAPPGA